MHIRQFHKSDEKAVVQLWQDCDLIVPWNTPQSDIKRKLSIQPELFLIGLIDEKIIASAMGGYDGHRGWVYYLAVHPEQQNKGFGRQIIYAIERLLVEPGLP